jgi:hypothetical protein
MTPQRARWARYSAWRVHEQAKLDALEKRKAELQAQIDAPSETETKIQAGVRRTADWLAGRTAEESDAANAKALADKLAEQRPLARAAEQELQELSEKIDVAQLRAKKIAERELDFLRPALIEAAERHGLGKLYAERVDALREVMELLFGLGAEFRGYQDGLPHVADVELPSAGALGSPPDILSRNAQCGVWRRLADALRRDPRCDASKILRGWHNCERSNVR